MISSIFRKLMTTCILFALLTSISLATEVVSELDSSRQKLGLQIQVLNNLELELDNAKERSEVSGKIAIASTTLFAVTHLFMQFAPVGGWSYNPWEIFKIIMESRTVQVAGAVAAVSTTYYFISKDDVEKIKQSINEAKAQIEASQAEIEALKSTYGDLENNL